MKIFWIIVVIVVIILGFKLLSKDSPADQTSNEAAAVLSETDATAGDQTGDAMTDGEESAATDEGTETPAN